MFGCALLFLADNFRQISWHFLLSVYSSHSATILPECLVCHIHSSRGRSSISDAHSMASSCKATFATSFRGRSSVQQKGTILMNHHVAFSAKGWIFWICWSAKAIFSFDPAREEMLCLSCFACLFVADFAYASFHHIFWNRRPLLRFMRLWILSYMESMHGWDNWYVCLAHKSCTCRPLLMCCILSVH